MSCHIALRRNYPTLVDASSRLTHQPLRQIVVLSPRAPDISGPLSDALNVLVRVSGTVDIGNGQVKAGRRGLGSLLATFAAGGATRVGLFEVGFRGACRLVRPSIHRDAPSRAHMS